MRIFFTIMSIILFGTACQNSNNIEFISSDRQEVTIGYMKFADNTRRSEGTKETDADIAFNASIDFMNNSKLFPFKFKVKTIEFTDASPEGIKKTLAIYSKEIASVAAWVGTKSTGINLSLGDATINSKVPIMFPITSKSFFTQGYSNLYQMTPSNATYGYRTFDLAKSLGIKRLLVIEDSSIIYSGEYAEAFMGMNKIKNNAIDVTIINGNYSANKENINEEIRDHLKNGRFDGVFFPGYANDINSVLGIMEAMGSRIPLLAGDEAGDTNTIFNKLRGLNTVYYISYYPIKMQTDTNPKTRSNIEAFMRFFETSGENLFVSQFYFSTPIIIGGIINNLLRENPSFTNKEAFYELFNNTARTKSFLALSDFPIKFNADGSVAINTGELLITKATKEGGTNIGRM